MAKDGSKFLSEEQHDQRQKAAIDKAMSTPQSQEEYFKTLNKIQNDLNNPPKESKIFENVTPGAIAEHMRDEGKRRAASNPRIPGADNTYHGGNTFKPPKNGG
jgi:hypothetical protein